MAKKEAVRAEAIRRHDIDSRIFQGRYTHLEKGKYTNAFIYGRYQLFEEVDQQLNGLPNGAKVLDLGCGTGHFTQYIKEQNFEVTGLDPSREMLAFAQENFEDIPFVEGIATALPFPDQHFDFVLLIEVLRYLHQEDVVAAYHEIYRVLKPGGKILATHVNKMALDGYFFYYHLAKWKEQLSGQTYHNCYFTNAQKEIDILKSVGFSDAKSIGRMYASIRFGYKFGHGIGSFWARSLEKWNKKQLLLKEPQRSFAAHLVVSGVR